MFRSGVIEGAGEKCTQRAARRLIKPSLQSELSHDLRNLKRQAFQGVYDDTPLPCQLLLIERCHEMRRLEAIVKRGELTNEAWARIAPLLPENGRRGGR